jgi:hypothetical protein
MLTKEINITKKVFKKLSIQISLNGLSYCCFDTLNKTIITFKEINFDQKEPNFKIENAINDSFTNYPELRELYDEVLVIHANNLSTFVPQSLFDEDYLGSYLQYNIKVFNTDFFAFDVIPNYELNSVYIPYVNINNLLIDHFGSFDYKHSSTILVPTLLIASKNKDEKKMFVHFSSFHFEIIIVENQKLLLYNSFDYNTPEDFIYYILFTAEQLNLNPENFHLDLIGDIESESEYFKIAYKYIRNVSLINSEDFNKNNNFSEVENRKHFILFNS